ncbi:ATP-binding protein [Streptomyces sp. ID05-26A]|nr:ATP-binding protein [Streptomyces sp. ID05-26A]
MIEPAPTVLYLGPELPRWQPRTLADVQALLDAGELAEGHWLEAKQEVGFSPGKKEELARDLASFANDGGVLLIGIVEDKQAGTFSVQPQPLDGLPEKIEQIVRYRCDPPLFVRCHRIVDPSAPGGANQGVLAVEVPPSPLAPHMVKGKYHGRGDSVKHVLSDAEVERLHVIRRARQVLAEELIDNEIARDPVQKSGDTRLYVVAKPLASPPELLTEHLIDPAIRSLIFEAAPDDADTTWHRLLKYNEHRARGVGWCSPNLRGRRMKHEPGERGRRVASDLEVWDDGTLTLYANAMSSNMKLVGKDFLAVRVGHVLGLVRGTVKLAGALGAKFGYAGQWQFAVGVTGLMGRADEVPERLQYRTDPEELDTFSEDRYVTGTMASTIELAEQPAAVTRRLMMRFARGFGVLDRYETDSYLGPPAERDTKTPDQ